MRSGHNRNRARGFTLVEMLVVLLLVGLLASLVVPVVTGSIDRASESTLKEDLFVMRKAIDAYYADKQVYPETLAELVQQRYLRAIPKDPLTGRTDSWRFEYREIAVAGGRTARGIADIHSGHEGQSSEGTPYAQW